MFVQIVVSDWYMYKECIYCDKLYKDGYICTALVVVNVLRKKRVTLHIIMINMTLMNNSLFWSYRLMVPV